MMIVIITNLRDVQDYYVQIMINRRKECQYLFIIYEEKVVGITSTYIYTCLFITITE